METQRELEVSRVQKGTQLLVHLKGPIEGAIDFEKKLGLLTSELCVNTQAVPRVNSVGIKAWISYFQKVKEQGIKLRFVECSIAIVEQFNLVSNFACGGTIESIYVPFKCLLCEDETRVLFNVQDLNPNQSPESRSKCAACGGLTVFDDAPEEYLGFLKKKVLSK